MKENIKIYICKHCGNVCELINDSGVNMVCCGEEMNLLDSSLSVGATEKHTPVYNKVEDEIVVSVGEVSHPMEKEHYIMWCALVTDNTMTRVTLYPEQDINIRFKYVPNSTIYAYCNKHGLWKTIVK